MLHKYLILIALSVSVINVVGQNDYRNLFRYLLDSTAHSDTWKTEIEETLTDKVVERLESKLTDVLEARLVFNFEKALEERLVLKLEERLAKKVEESLERKMETKLGKILAENLENKLEDKLKPKLEQKLEDTLKVQLEKPLVEKLATKLEENLEYKLATKFEPYLGAKVAGKLDKKLTETLQILLRENIENKLNEIALNYRRQCEQDKKIIQEVEWVKTKPDKALYALRDRALVAGYDGEGSQVWIIRGLIENKLVPGKLIQQSAAVAWNGKVNDLTDEIEVFCAPKERVKWVESRSGDNAVPSCAFDAGNTAPGHALYVGRARVQNTWIPGVVNPESGLFISHNSQVITRDMYEILCLA